MEKEFDYIEKLGNAIVKDMENLPIKEFNLSEMIEELDERERIDVGFIKEFIKLLKESNVVCPDCFCNFSIRTSYGVPLDLDKLVGPKLI